MDSQTEVKLLARQLNDMQNILTRP